MDSEQEKVASEQTINTDKSEEKVTYEQVELILKQEKAAREQVELILKQEKAAHEQVKLTLKQEKADREQAELILKQEKAAREQAEQLAHENKKIILHEKAIKRISDIKHEFSSKPSDNDIFYHSGYIYIAASRDDFKRMFFKVGRTCNLRNRLQAYKCGHPEISQPKYLRVWAVAHSKLVETYLLEILKQWAVSPSKDFSNTKFSTIEIFHIPLESLVIIIDMVIDHLENISKEILEYLKNNTIINNAIAHYDELAMNKCLYYPTDRFPLQVRSRTFEIEMERLNKKLGL